MPRMINYTEDNSLLESEDRLNLIKYLIAYDKDRLTYLRNLAKKIEKQLKEEQGK